MPYTLLAALLLLFTAAVRVHAEPVPAEPDPPAVLELQPIRKTAPQVIPVLPLPIDLLPLPGGEALPPTGPIPMPAPGPPSLQTIKAYYVGYADDSFAALKRYISSVDIVAGQWLAVDSAGRLAESPDHGRNDQVRQLAHDAGKKVYTCVVNKDFARSVLSAVLQSQARRTAVIDRIVAYVEREGDDGIDLDFEGVRTGHRDGYTAFVRELAQKLHARGRELSLACDVNWDGTPSAGYDYRALGVAADSVMPMTYTYGPGKTPIAPMSYLENATRAGVQAMDPSRFMIGMGVYGRSYDVRSGRRSNPNAATIQAIVDRYDPTVLMDPETLTKKFSYQDQNGRYHVVFFDDPETIREKLTRLGTQYGVASVGFWRMGQESPRLWDTIEVALGRRQPAPEASVAGAPLVSD